MWAGVNRASTISDKPQCAEIRVAAQKVDPIPLGREYRNRRAHRLRALLRGRLGLGSMRYAVFTRVAPRNGSGLRRITRRMPSF